MNADGRIGQIRFFLFQHFVGIFMDAFAFTQENTHAILS